MRGDVYLIRHRKVTSPKPHYCIVASPDDDGGRRVVLAFASSKCETRIALARRMKQPPETVVKVAPGQYSEFRLPTVIDCNFAQIDDTGDFMAATRERSVKKLTPIPKHILDRIIVGVLASDRTTAEMKRLVGPAPAKPPPGPPKIKVSKSS